MPSFQQVARPRHPSPQSVVFFWLPKWTRAMVQRLVTAAGSPHRPGSAAWGWGGGRWLVAVLQEAPASASSCCGAVRARPRAGPAARERMTRGRHAQRSGLTGWGRGGPWAEAPSSSPPCRAAWAAPPRCGRLSEAGRGGVTRPRAPGAARPRAARGPGRAVTGRRLRGRTRRRGSGHSTAAATAATCCPTRPAAAAPGAASGGVAPRRARRAPSPGGTAAPCPA